jgi:hypothetical protein
MTIFWPLMDTMTSNDDFFGVHRWLRLYEESNAEVLLFLAFDGYNDVLDELSKDDFRFALCLIFFFIFFLSLGRCCSLGLRDKKFCGL